MGGKREKDNLRKTFTTKCTIKVTSIFDRVIAQSKQKLNMCVLKGQLYFQPFNLFFQPWLMVWIVI